MAIVHRIHVDDAFLQTTQQLVISQSAMTRLMYTSRWFPWPPRLIIGGFLAFLIWQRDWANAAIFAPFLVFSFLTPWLGLRNLRRARERNSLKGTEITITTDEQGVHNTNKHGSGSIQWTGIKQAIVRPDGVGIKLLGRSILWLPDQSIVEGSASALREQVRQHVTDCVTAA